ncbi:MAG: M23 family peptidase, partial [Proteobacteria bacterium]|nr:M23 family peptidase [Pseudomonadota bacterium]
MSYQSSQYAEYPQRHAHDHGRAHSRRHVPVPAPSSSVKESQRGYTIAHAGKQVRLGPVVFWIVIGTITVLGLWSAATATYFAFRDDVLTRLISRQADMQYSYEDRIAELRARIDRSTSRQLLDQEQFDKKLDEIVRRQATLESRAAALNALPDVAATGSIKGLPRKPASASEASPSGTIKPSPINDTAVFVAPPDREARLESRTPASTNQQPIRLAKADGAGAELVRLESSLNHVENRQMAELNSVEDHMESRVRRMRGIFSDLGLNVAKMEAATPHAGMGGPYVPIKLPADAGPFERQLYRVNITQAQIEQLNRTLALVPYRKPVVGEVEFTSG